jgi:acetoin utilization deacetylase AcuC-like enzyme
MTVRVYTHPACLSHDTGSGHPERPQRLAAVTEALHEAFDDLDWQQSPCAGRAELLRVHTPGLLAQVLETQATGVVALDPDTLLSPGSAEAALRAAGAGIAAVDAAVTGGASRAFCAVRPPGHHATASTAMGFCLFNSVAVAAMHALERHGLSRVAIVDFDVHHGNGTQDIFADDARVLYASTHQWPLYPGTGAAQERGLGNLRNAPLPPGCGGRRFRQAWVDALLPAIDGFAPQLLLVSAGFDGHWRDPLAQVQLDAEDYAWLTRELAVLSQRHAAGRLVSMLEGGYDLQALRECSVAHVEALRGTA